MNRLNQMRPGMKTLLLITGIAAGIVLNIACGSGDRDLVTSAQAQAVTTASTCAQWEVEFIQTNFSSKPQVMPAGYEPIAFVGNLDFVVRKCKTPGGTLEDGVDAGVAPRDAATAVADR